MAQGNHHRPGLLALGGRVIRTSVGAIENRIELAAVEWQEERLRLAELLAWAVGLIFAGILGVLLLTATIIFLFPPDTRIYVMGAFAALYLLAAVAAWLGFKSLLKREPFTETLDQVRKDRVWLDSFK